MSANRPADCAPARAPERPPARQPQPPHRRDRAHFDPAHHTRPPLRGTDARNREHHRYRRAEHYTNRDQSGQRVRRPQTMDDEIQNRSEARLTMPVAVSLGKASQPPKARLTGTRSRRAITRWRTLLMAAPESRWRGLTPAPRGHAHHCSRRRFARFSATKRNRLRQPSGFPLGDVPCSSAPPSPSPEPRAAPEPARVGLQTTGSLEPGRTGYFFFV